MKKYRKNNKKLRIKKPESIEDLADLMKQALFKLGKGEIDHKEANSIISGATKLVNILKTIEVEKKKTEKERLQGLTEEQLYQELEDSTKKILRRMKKEDVLKLWRASNKNSNN